MSTRKRSDEDFAREIQAHIEIETERLIDDGMPPAEARVAARRRFGNVTGARERLYEAGRLLWLDHLVQDLRCAARNMRRYPVASLVAVLSLAAGIGATTVTLTVRDIIFRKPPPLYQNPEELSKIQIGSPANPIMPVGNAVPVGLYQSWRDALGPSIAAFTSPGSRDVRVGDRTASVPLREVTPELFSVLGVAPSPGSSFSASPAAASGPPPAILSRRVWQHLFDQRADAIGEIVWIDDEAHIVVGVMPERFWFANMDSPIWRPLDPRTLASDARVGVIARRSPGSTHAALDARLQNGAAGIRATAALRGIVLRNSGSNGFFDLSIDARILVQTAIIALFTGIAAGVGPALYETRRLHTNPLRAIASSSDRIRQRWRNALVVFEIAVTIALLVVTATMIDGFALSRLVRAGGGAGSIWDPAYHSFVLPVLIVTVVGALATWIPSRRALKIDPVVLLRTQ